MQYIICLLLCVSVSVYICVMRPKKDAECSAIRLPLCSFKTEALTVSGAWLTSSRPEQSSCCLHLSHAFYYNGVKLRIQTQVFTLYLHSACVVILISFLFLLVLFTVEDWGRGTPYPSSSNRFRNHVWEFANQLLSRPIAWPHYL